MLAVKKEQLSLPFDDSATPLGSVLTKPENADAHFKKGQYVVCRYDGDNGDLIVGKVESVRSNGEVLLTNLLTNGHSVKSHAVLVARNKIVPKKVALHLWRTFHTLVATSSDASARRAVRKEAITVAAAAKAVAARPVKARIKEVIVTFYVLLCDGTWKLTSVPLLPLNDPEATLIERARQVLEERLKEDARYSDLARYETIGPVKSVEK